MNADNLSVGKPLECFKYKKKRGWQKLKTSVCEMESILIEKKIVSLLKPRQSVAAMECLEPRTCLAAFRLARGTPKLISLSFKECITVKKKKKT